MFEVLLYGGNVFGMLSLFSSAIQHFHLRYQYLLYGTEESVYIIDMRKEFNSHRIVLVHGRDDVM